MRKISILLGISLLCASPIHISASPLPVVESVRPVEDSQLPEYPSEHGFAVVNLNIRDAPDGKIIGRYKKGECVTILGKSEENSDSWLKTDQGYVWGGYLSHTYHCNLSIHSLSEHSSHYVGYTYDLIDQLDKKYTNLLRGYEIYLCDDPLEAYPGNEIAKEKGKTVNGLTHISGSSPEKVMYLRSSIRCLKEAFYHELGHIIDYQIPESPVSDSADVTTSYNNERENLKKTYSIDDCNLRNNAEYFAESFQISLTDPDGLKEHAPIIASIFENMEASLTK